MPEPDSTSTNFLEILRSERRDLLSRLRQTRFSTLKKGYSQAQIIPHASYAPWLDDLGFLALYEMIKAFTLVDIYRCYELWVLARQMGPVQGDIMEVGVWRGGTAALMAGAAPDKAVHLFDTFAGVAKADRDHDTLYSGGEHADAEQGTVEGLFHKLGLKCKINVGVFPDETVEFRPDRVALLHIDVDTYASAKDSFCAAWPMVSPGGVAVFDDYGFFGCEGVAQAVNEIKATTDDALFVHNLNGHALLVKKQ